MRTASSHHPPLAHERQGQRVFQELCSSTPNQGAASPPCIADKGLGREVAVIWMSDDPYSKGIREHLSPKRPESWD